jgi:hypothetical protein
MAVLSLPNDAIEKAHKPKLPTRQNLQFSGYFPVAILLALC